MRYLISLLIPVILFSSSDRLAAQTEQTQDSKLYIWLDGGYGEGSFGDNAALELSLLNRLGLFSARYNTLEASTASASDDFRYDGYYLTEMTEYALMYGQVYQRPYWIASLSVGLSVIRTGYNYNYIESSTIGLPFQAEIFVTPFPFAGFGVTFNSNMNGANSFTSTVFCARFGLVRYESPREKAEK